ncbi:uncharacterized protein FA14DRAFT_179000 [Meira miltonrushii]|uniref:Uncharacterized protein n=1 Tax=Meira miltonrushii TaxID=1280837 RepID=A0A316VJF7_9BASI|nr:uncharacterized protein FA14DRAFT_179000 [Meira miltonrushii]PWN35635.1 hypothetical protein FA14DRAFT_179000 [Meira miltonrushii]
MKATLASLLILATSLSLINAKDSNFVHLKARRHCKALAQKTFTFDDNDYDASKLSPLLDDKTASAAGIRFAGFYGFKNTEKSGVEAASPPNQIVGGAVNGLLDGQHSMYVAQGNPQNIDYFDLEGLSFGCTLLTNDALGLLPGVAQPCKMTMTGYYQGKVIGKRTYNYQPDGQTQSDPQQVKMTNQVCHHDFKGVDKVVFTTDNKLLKAVNLDNIIVVPHTCTQ